MRRNPFTILALVAAIHATALPVWAQQPATGAQQPAPSPIPVVPGGDTVHLRNGGMLRGTINEILPNDHVSMTLATGQTATIAWAQVEKIERTSAAAPPAQLTPMPGVVRMIFVHVESERSVRLEQRTATKKGWALVCTSPCDTQVPLDAEYRVSGDGVRASSAFTIAGNPGGRVLLEIDPGSKAGFVGGIVIVSIAPIVALVGLVVWAVGSIDTADTSTRNTGIATTLVGVAGIAAGIILIATNASTKQTQSLQSHDAPPPASAANLLRWPQWRDEGPVPPASPQAMIPVLRF